MSREPSGYLWRRYDVGRPYWLWQRDAPCPAEGYVLWPALDTGQLAHLNRWEGLQPAFLGFVSRGLGPLVACAYDANAALQIIQDTIVQPSWTSQVSDHIEAFEYLEHNLVNVWMGEKTPFLATADNYLKSLLRKG